MGRDGFRTGFMPHLARHLLLGGIHVSFLFSAFGASFIFPHRYADAVFNPIFKERVLLVKRFSWEYAGDSPGRYQSSGPLRVLLVRGSPMGADGWFWLCSF